MKFSFKDFSFKEFSFKQFPADLAHLLKKALMENFIVCAM